jgi:hypothetical protein
MFIPIIRLTNKAACPTICKYKFSCWAIVRQMIMIKKIILWIGEIKPSYFNDYFLIWVHIANTNISFNLELCFCALPFISLSVGYRRLNDFI